MLLSAKALDVDSVKNLNELIVSATRSKSITSISKIDAPLRQIPITANVLTGQELQLKGFSEPAQALRDVTSVNAYRDYGAFHMFSVRGFYETLIVNDGMRDNRHTLYQSAPITGIGSVERIEVLKGAASMQQGHSAIGGVINIVRKQPSRETSGYARLSAGSWNTYRLNAGATGEVAKGLTLRADVEGVRSDGWRENYTKGFNASLSAKYIINDRSSLQLSVYGNKDTYGGDYGQPHYPWTVYNSSDNKVAFNRGELNGNIHPRVSYGYTQDSLAHKNLSTSLKYELRLSDKWKLTEHAFLSLDDIDYMSTDAMEWVLDEHNATLPYYILEGSSKKYTDLKRVKRTGFPFAYTTTSFQNQLELSGEVYTGEVKHQLILSYNYLNLLLNRFQRGAVSGPGFGTSVDAFNPQRYQGDLTWKFQQRHRFADQTHGLSIQDYARSGQFAFLGGVRLDYFSRDYKVHATDHQTVKNLLSRGVFTNLALTYRGGVVWMPLETFNLYVSASNFYKPQRASVQPSTIYLDNTGKEMDNEGLGKLPPTKGHQFELGAHLTLGNQLDVHAALFHIDYKNKLTSIGRKGSTNVMALINGYVSKGFEVEVDYTPVKTFQLQAGYSYTDIRVSPYTTVDATSPLFVGNQRAKTPKHRLTSWAFYRPAIGNKQSLTLGLGMEHSSKSFTGDNNIYTMPSYTLLHALASYKWSKWTIQLNANNLLNTRYTRNAISQNQYIPGEERNFTASLVYNF